MGYYPSKYTIEYIMGQYPCKTIDYLRLLFNIITLSYRNQIINLRRYIQELEKEGAIKMIPEKNPYGSTQHTFALIDGQKLDKDIFQISNRELSGK